MAATKKQKEEFYNTVAPMIVKIAKEKGYKFPSAIISQAVCESATGTSKLSQPPHFNFFGMKCGSKWKGKSVNMKTMEEYKVGTLTQIRDHFRSYENLEDGIRGYFDFINTSRYENLKHAESVVDYFMLLKQDGYATSSSYVATLSRIWTANNLARFDEIQTDIRNDKKSVRIKTRGSNLRLRKEPSTNCAVLGYIPNGTVVQYEKTEKSDWLKVEYNGKVGYIYRYYTEEVD